MSLAEAGTGTQLPLQQRQTVSKHTDCLRQCTMERNAVPARRSPSVPECNISTSTMAFDQHFTTTAKGILLLAEIVSVNVDFKTFSIWRLSLENPQWFWKVIITTKLMTKRYFLVIIHLISGDNFNVYETLKEKIHTHTHTPRDNLIWLFLDTYESRLCVWTKGDSLITF